MIHVQDIDATKRELIHQLLFQYCHVSMTVNLASGRISFPITVLIMCIPRKTMTEGCR